MDVVGVKVQSVVSMVLIVLSIHPLHGRKQGLMTDPFILCLGISIHMVIASMVTNYT